MMPFGTDDPTVRSILYPLGDDPELVNGTGVLVFAKLPDDDEHHNSRVVAPDVKTCMLIGNGTGAKHLHALNMFRPRPRKPGDKTPLWLAFAVTPGYLFVCGIVPSVVRDDPLKTARVNVAAAMPHVRNWRAIRRPQYPPTQRTVQGLKNSGLDGPTAEVCARVNWEFHLRLRDAFGHKYKTALFPPSVLADTNAVFMLQNLPMYNRRPIVEQMRYRWRVAMALLGVMAAIPLVAHATTLVEQWLGSDLQTLKLVWGADAIQAVCDANNAFCETTVYKVFLLVFYAVVIGGPFLAATLSFKLVGVCLDVLFKPFHCYLFPSQRPGVTENDLGPRVIPWHD